MSVLEFWPGTCYKSKTGRLNQNRSRRSTNHRRILTRPVLIVATGLGFATRPSLTVDDLNLAAFVVGLAR